MADGGRVHLVTGFPGFIGKRLVRRLVEARLGEADRLVLLVQAKNARAARDDLAALGPLHLHRRYERREIQTAGLN